jgi:hypothetical protein
MPKRLDQRRAAIAEHLDTVTAIWILASNDERPEISYVGLRHRLRIVDGLDERRLVAERGELFRLSIPGSRLEELKSHYREGQRLPSWLRKVPEAERGQTIDRLTVDDFFRSQFRTQAEAPRSPIEIVDWGLKHIDRLRTAAVEERDSPVRWWTSVWIPLLSVLVALMAVGSTMYVQRQGSIDQRALKEYEVGFRPKVDGYTRLMQAVSTSFERATVPGGLGLRMALNEVDLAAIQLEPFLKKDVRERLRNEIQNFMQFCLDVGRRVPSTSKVSDKDIDLFVGYRNGLRNVLYGALFQ